MGEVAFKWLRPMGVMTLWFLPFVLITWYSFMSFPTLARLVVNALLAGTIGAGLLIRFGIPIQLRNDIFKQVPVWGIPILQRIMSSPQ